MQSRWVLLPCELSDAHRLPSGHFRCDDRPVNYRMLWRVRLLCRRGDGGNQLLADAVRLWPADVELDIDRIHDGYPKFVSESDSHRVASVDCESDELTIASDYRLSNTDRIAELEPVVDPVSNPFGILDPISFPYCERDGEHHCQHHV